VYWREGGVEVTKEEEGEEEIKEEQMFCSYL
jgi:hypothetical protein